MINKEIATSDKSSFAETTLLKRFFLSSLFATLKSLGTKDLQNTLEINLPGNKADLSQDKNHYDSSSSKSILINKIEEITPVIHNLNRIDIILDNAGMELFTDLLLCYWLLENTKVKEIHLHFKSMPYFVSDALTPDLDFYWKRLKFIKSYRFFQNILREKSRKRRSF